MLTTGKPCWRGRARTFWNRITDFRAYPKANIRRMWLTAIIEPELTAGRCEVRRTMINDQPMTGRSLRVRLSVAMLFSDTSRAFPNCV